MEKSTFQTLIKAGIPKQLPPKKAYPEEGNPAPERRDLLSAAEKQLAIRNALRYFPTSWHQELAAEFLEELNTLGRIYMHRFKPPYELYARDFSNRVVMLSACETGVGRQVRGEGTFSLARAFAKTGSPAIITTLWPVDDEKSASLVPTFYEAVAKGMPLKQALQTAKTSYINHANKFTAHPAYWSAYVQSGDIQFGSTFSGNRLIHTIAVILLLGLGIVGFAAYRKKQTRHKMPGMM